MQNKVILLVEDNQDDEALILRAVDKNGIRHEVVVARADSYRLGANGYVRKSVDFADFSEAVPDLTRYWLSVNTAPPSTV